MGKSNTIFFDSKENSVGSQVDMPCCILWHIILL